MPRNQLWDVASKCLFIGEGSYDEYKLITSNIHWLDGPPWLLIRLYYSYSLRSMLSYFVSTQWLLSLLPTHSTVIYAIGSIVSRYCCSLVLNIAPCSYYDLNDFLFNVFMNTLSSCPRPMAPHYLRALARWVFVHVYTGAQHTTKIVHFLRLTVVTATH